jgi:hypothetical protein
MPIESMKPRSVSDRSPASCVDVTEGEVLGQECADLLFYRRHRFSSRYWFALLGIRRSTNSVTSNPSSLA